MLFLCVTSPIEKALKGLFQKILQSVPPKTHNLIFLLDKIGLRPNEQKGKFITRLNEANISTRYPEDIELLQRNYTAAVTEDLLTQAKDILEWIRKQY
jgi:HEPN domain-containing protein